MKKLKWYWWVLIAAAVFFIVILLLDLTFLSSNDGWNSTEREINSNNVLISGSGNEPGWNFKIRGENLDNEVNLYGFDLTTEYGEKTWSGILAKSYQEDYSENFQFRGDISRIVDNQISTTTEDTKSVIIYFENKECIDDAGKSHGLTVDLDINSEQELKSCADIQNQ